jgi:hypothetical protein
MRDDEERSGGLRGRDGATLDEKHGPDASAALLTEENPQVTAQVKNSSLVREYRLDPARYRGTRKRTLVLLGIVLLLAIGAQVLR